jgi:hypothetical protein
VTNPPFAAEPASESDAHVKSLVLGYLDDHPTAMDTLDGIAEWWVLRQQIDIEVRRVARALAALVSDGLIEECEQGGIRFYRRPRPGASSFNTATGA